MPTSFITETVDQELQLEELSEMNGGLLLMLIAALLPGVANAPGEGDDVYTKPGMLEVIKTGSTLGESDGKAGTGVWQPPGEEDPGPGVWY